MPKIKGTHNAMKSGMLAAEAAFAQISLPESDETSSSTVTAPAAADLSAYEQAVKDSWIWSELYEVRNVKPSFHSPLGNLGGFAYAGVDTLLLKGRGGWTFRNKVEDFDATKKAS